MLTKLTQVVGSHVELQKQVVSGCETTCAGTRGGASAARFYKSACKFNRLNKSNPPAWRPLAAQGGSAGKVTAENSPDQDAFLISIGLYRI